MRLWILVIMIWGLIACSPRGLTPPPPTGSPVELKVDDIQLELVTETGWQTYTSDDRIVLSYEATEADDIVVNVWIPEISMDQYETLVDVGFDVAEVMERQEELSVTAPISTTWDGNQAVYFVAENDVMQTSLIIVVQIDDETVTALNIQGVDADFLSLKRALAETFASFSVNDVALGGEIFVALPDRLLLPSRNPEAALDPSAEP